MRAGWLAMVVSAAALSAGEYQGLPERAIVLEERLLPGWAHPYRSLILWVIESPSQTVAERLKEIEKYAADEPYTCPEQHTGKSYSAPARVSLVDTRTKRIINTQALEMYEKDEYHVPLRMRPGYFFKVRGPLVKGEGRPILLDLADLNGDGHALEFALYRMDSCTGPLTKVLGYSRRQDRVITYNFHLIGRHWDDENPVETWMDRFVMQKPVSRMNWQYDFWYNSGVHIKFDIRYVPEKERFEGTVRTGASKIDRRLEPK